MTKNEYLVPVIVIVLTVVFAFVSFAVFLSHGKSSFWLSKKMKIGALLISLTVITQQSCIVATCYDPVPPNYLEVDGINYNDTLNIDLQINNSIPGTIFLNEGGKDFSFNITDSTKTDTIQRGNILPLDGIFNSSNEDFEIKVDTNLQSGIYCLNLFTADVLEQNQSNYKCILNIANED